MLSNLGPLFRTTFRQAESADARMEIRREEKDSGKRKQYHEDPGTDDNDFWEDSMAVSIPALRTFLIDFLKNHGAPSPEDVGATEDVANFLTTDYIDTPPPVSPLAAKAIKAYTSLSTPTPTITPAAPAHNMPEHPLSPLKPDEIRAIFKLIEDLTNLNRAGMDTLTFRMTGTFVDSLQDAVNALTLSPPSANE